MQCTVQRRIESSVSVSGKTGFLGEIHKSIIGVRGERVWVQCKWEHLAEWLFIQMGTVWTGFWSKEKHVAFRTNERYYPILRKPPPKLCFLFLFTSCRRLKEPLDCLLSLIKWILFPLNFSLFLIFKLVKRQRRLFLKYPLGLILVKTFSIKFLAHEIKPVL